MKKFNKKQKFNKSRISNKGVKTLSTKTSGINLVDRLLAEAKIDPKYKELLSKVLMRELIQEKEDTRHYNTRFISRSDSQTLDFMDAGIRNDFSAGDSVLFHGTIASKKGIDWIIDSVKSAMENKDYISFPFGPEVSADLRTKYLLRTENTDTNDSILKELSGAIKSVMSPADSKDLFVAIKKAEQRFKNTKVEFVSPLDGEIIGKPRVLSKEEKEKYKFNAESEIIIDERSDDHDLVSLKDLIRVCNKNNSIEELGLFAGALNKYLPELREMGYRGIVFEVERSVLSEVKLVKRKHEEFPFGPVESAVALLEYFEENEKDPQIVFGKNYYVSVNGFVAAAGRDKGVSHGYDRIYLMNEKIVPASETFLYQKDNSYFSESAEAVSLRKRIKQTKSEDAVLCTRLYFYANEPKLLHPLFQNHSLVYGGSDHTFNSCATGEDDYHNDEINRMFKDHLNDFGDLQSGVKIARHLFLAKGSHDLLVNSVSYEEIGKEVSDSIYGENNFTVKKYLYFMGLAPKMAKIKEMIDSMGLLAEFHPLTSRFIYFNYVKGKNGGLVKSPQLTTFNRAIKRHDPREILEDIAHGLKVVNGLSKLNDLINNGIKIQDAWESSFDKETKERLSKK